MKALSLPAKSLLKGSILFLSMVGLALLLSWSDMAGFLESDRFSSYVRQHYSAGCLVFIGIAALGSALSVPRQFLGWCAGYLFGAGLGLLWVNLAATLGCALSFIYSRYVGRNTLQKLFGQHLEPVNRFLCASPFGATLTIRFMPFGHNATVNVLAGLSQIQPLPFIFGSFIGYIPQHLIFSLLGSGVQVSTRFSMGAASVLFVLSSLLGYAVYKKHSKRKLLANILDIKDDDAPPSGTSGIN